MDIEFHYYITYILSRKAGFNSDDSYIIAYSSQYTDDNTYRYFVNFEDGSYYLNEISQTMDITKPSKTREKIYPLFHFIPAGNEILTSDQFKNNPGHLFTTIPDSKNAQKFIDAALKSRDLYKIGIAVHAYADTWSHQNFIGYKHPLNGKKGFGKLTPNIGHADFIHEPDKVHNRWKDERLKNAFAEIDNDRRFLDAAKAIFIRLWRYNNPGLSLTEAQKKYDEMDLETRLLDAMDDTYLWGSDDKARVKAYKAICEELGRENYMYDSNAWRYDALEKREFETDLFDRYWAKRNFYNSDWHSYQEAVKWYRTRALKTLAPLYKEVGLAI